MHIAILGAGNIGRTLGVKWAQAGHQIVFGVRDPGSPRVQAALEATGGAATAASLEAACRSGAVVLFAIPARAVEGVVQAHAGALAGKVVIDATNRFGDPVINSLASFDAYAPTARPYRAFNSLGWEVFEQPRIGGQAADHFYCGPPGEGQAVLEALIGAVGLRPIYLGDLDQAPLVDNLGALWVHLAYTMGKGRRLALQLMAG